MASQTNWRNITLPLALGLSALALGVYQLGNTGFWGDEYNSLLEFTQPGYHPHSVPFFVLLRGWSALANGSQTLEWLRLLSALFAAALVPVVYGIGLEMTGQRAGGVGMALMAALSAWRVEEGQEVRFYAYFMLTAALMLWGVLRWQRTRRWRDGVLIVIGVGLTVTAHLLGSLFVLTSLGFGLPWASRRARWWLLAGIIVVALCLAVLPSVLPDPVMQTAYSVLGMYQGGNNVSGGYSGPRGISVGTLFKPAYALYIYLLGTSVYPLDWGVSLSALAIMVSAMAVGAWAWQKHLEMRLLLMAWSVVPSGLLFFTLDSIAPPGYTQPGAHHIAPAVFVVWISVGWLLTQPQWWAKALYVGAVVASGAGLWAYYTGDWSLTARKDVDMRLVSAQAVQRGCAPETLLVMDGRMLGPADVYLPSDCGWQWIYEAPDQFTTRHITLWYVSTTSDKAAIPALQRRLAEAGYVVQDRYAYGLAIVETYARLASPLLPDGQLALLWSPPPLGFNSLRLPQPSQTMPATQIFGAVLLQPAAPTQTVVLPSDSPRFRGLALTSSAFQANGEVGVLEAELWGGRVLTFPVTVGVHTADWAAAGCAQCEIAFSWRKKLDKLGRSAYPGAWADFQAKGFTTVWQWPQSEAVQAIRLRLNEITAGQWWVWQIVPVPAP